MMKRISALTLCLAMLVGILAGCGGLKGDDKGAYIAMYLTDEIYDFDPANAYHNTDAINVLGMLYEPLFTLTSGGKIKGALAQSYKTFTDDDGVHMEITLRPTYWSNGTYALTANDCIFAWRRLLDPNNGFTASSLLFDIKNARAYNQGLMTKDDLMVEAVEQQVVRITFENDVDVNAFLLNLTNVATAPLLEAAVKKNADWAKKASTLITSGPLKMAKIVYEEAKDENGKPVKVNDDNALDVDGNPLVDLHGNPTNAAYKVQKVSYFMLERNAYYYRDTERDALDKYVTPFRILVNCSMTDEELLEEYKNDHLFYIGSVPLSLREDEFVKKNVKVTDALSTFVCYLNENAEINGQKIFADAHLRRALSLALDREAIAQSIVYAAPATGLIGPGIFEKGSTGSFRKTAGAILGTTADLSAAQAELAKVEIEGFSAANFPFTIKVAAYDEVHTQIAKLMAEAWSALGFNVTVETVETIQNNDQRVESDQVSTPVDVCDDLFAEAIQRGKFEAIAFDYNAYTPSAYAMLSPFALGFSGSATMDENNDYTHNTHITGYNSTAYNDLMEAVYYLPYYTKMEADPDEELFDDPNTNPYTGFGFETYEEYDAVYRAITAVYAENGITPTDKPGKWAAQKAVLLHAAEKLLMEDLPVIPVVFNKNASLTSKKLTGVSSTYYVPAYFAKTNLKNYAKYTYVFYKYPNVNWDNFGLKEEP